MPWGQRAACPEDGSWVLVALGEGLWEYGTCTPYPLLMLAEISTLFIAIYVVMGLARVLQGLV